MVIKTAHDYINWKNRLESNPKYIGVTKLLMCNARKTGPYMFVKTPNKWLWGYNHRNKHILIRFRFLW